MPLSIAKRCKQYIAQRPGVAAALSKGFVNYSALARKIARDLGLDEEEYFYALLVAVRRHAAHAKPTREAEDKIRQLLQKSKVEVKSKIAVVVLSSRASFSALSKIFAELAEKEEPIHFVQGSKTITLILGEEWVERVKRTFGQFVVKESRGLVEIVMRSSREIESTPGVLDYVYGRLAEHGVNLLETASSWTDTIFVIEEKDLQKAMEAMRF